MKRRWSLRRLLLSSLVAYLVLLTAGVLANDMFVNERAENLVWESLLEVELEHFLRHRNTDPGYRWEPTEIFELFEIHGDTAPDTELSKLTPGIHDEIEIHGRERVVLVQDQGDTRFILALDITDLEGREDQIRQTVFLSALVSAVLLGLLAAWGASRLARPLKVLADEIRSLSPEQTGHRVAIPDGSSYELAVIAEAMNGYNERIDSFMEREREFINLASHELRTPLSIISGAVDLTVKEPGLPEKVVNRMARVKNTLSDVNELIVLLLVLAKNPERLVAAYEPVPLHILIPDIVEELEPLARGKGLSILVCDLEPSRMLAPPQMVKSAIANLIRNAIEHTHDGAIRVHLRAPASVTIMNPGEGSPAAELSRTYSSLARGSGRDGGGLGLALIARLCRHCGWSLSISDRDGIHMSLDFGSNVMQA